MSTTQKNSYTFTIPCKRYLCKFMESLYGAPFIADKHSSLGHFTMLCLEKNNYRYDKLPVARPELYNGKLNIQVSLWTYKRRGSDIEPERVVAINNYIEEVFCETLYWWCQVHTGEGRYKGYDQCIRNFAKKHNINIDDDDEDISFEGLKKKEHRYRKSREKKAMPLQQAV